MAGGDLLRPAQRHELDRAIRAAEQESRFEFSVYVGPATAQPRGFAERLHGSLTAPARSVLIVVDPQARAVEVVTGADVRRHLTDHAAELSVLQMQTAFAADDLAGGLKRGVAMLADYARPQRTLHAQE